MRINNPFIIAGDIPEDLFCDRKKELDRMMRCITNEGNMVLTAPRRMGKSKLIKHLFKQPEITESYYTFYVDILSTSSVTELAFSISQIVFDTVKSKSDKLLLSFAQALKSISGTFGFDPVTNLPSFSMEISSIKSPEFTLAEVLSWLEKADKPCVLCIDEFQQISRYPENKNGEVEALLRSHIQHMSNVRFIFSGSERHLLDEMFFSKAKPFYNSAEQLSLQPIPCDVYSAFAARLFTHYNKCIESDKISKYYDQLRGSTYYLQRLMRESFINTNTEECCNDTIIDRSLSNLIEESSERYRQQLGQMTERQKDVLYAIAKEGRAERVMSVAFLKSHNIPSASIMQAALRKLIDQDFVTTDAGAYMISDPMLEIYLQSGR